METTKRKFKLQGMSAPRSFTLLHNDDHFWAKSGLTEDRYLALFKYMKHENSNFKTAYATVEYSNAAADGTPIEGTVIEVEGI